jgi:hypothetical protein
MYTRLTSATLENILAYIVAGILFHCICAYWLAGLSSSASGIFQASIQHARNIAIGSFKSVLEEVSDGTSCILEARLRSQGAGLVRGHSYFSMVLSEASFHFHIRSTSGSLPQHHLHPADVTAEQSVACAQLALASKSLSSCRRST